MHLFRYTALVFADVMSFEDGLRLVQVIEEKKFPLPFSFDLQRNGKGACRSNARSCRHGQNWHGFSARHKHDGSKGTNLGFVGSFERGEKGV